jgi:predicted translin family RNA/ssDNA-binding protein
VDGAHEYVCLLCTAIGETRRALREDVEQATLEGATRRLDALQLVNYKLDRLERHLDASRRLLNDLRALRRLLLGERAGKPPGHTDTGTERP